MSKKKQARDHLPIVQDPLWYKDAIIYELHVRSFYDTAGDGVGDFLGLIQRLDYLQDLGVTALWLLPFYPSPLKDDGYDIADYAEINPLYGTLADFKVFMREAHRRGLRVIGELVVNHTSDRHPWFQRARRAPAGSAERDFYVWSETPDRYPEARIIFKDFEPSNWAWDPVARAYYWHRFYAHQPDLNYDNPAVHEAIQDVVDFWLDLGIDGLRLDAVPYLFERDGTNCENLPETHVYLKSLRQHVDAKHSARMLLAEANQWPEDAVAYFGAGDECHMAFHFPVMPRLFMATRMEDRFPIIDILQQTPAIAENCQWALFLRNHDELTLEMVTDEDRDYMYRVYAQDPQARINLGIRRRLAPLLGNHRGKIELMNGLLFSLPGTPVIYYGDEIGMGDNYYLGDRNGVRTPMQWSSERNAGFSRGNPQRLYLPVIIDPEYHYETVNVEAQQNNPHSLLWWMKHLIALRKRFKAFGRGSIEFLYPTNHRVLAFLRRYQDECILVVANLSRSVQYAELDLGAFKGVAPVEMFGWNAFPPIGDLPYLITLSPHAFYWFMLRPSTTVSLSPADNEGGKAVLEVQGKWENLFREAVLPDLQRALLDHIPKCPWFRGGNRSLRQCSLVEAVPLPNAKRTYYVLLVRVEYFEGDFETYSMPLGYAAENDGAAVFSANPAAVLCRIRVQGKKNDSLQTGVLYDPTSDPDFAQALLEACARNRRFKGEHGEIVACATSARPRPATGAMPILKTEHGRNSLIFGEHRAIKLFRVVEEGQSPDAEISRFLWEKTTFRNVPPLVGIVEYRSIAGISSSLAIIQELVTNEGSAWKHTLDALGRFFETVLTHKTVSLPPISHEESLVSLAEQELPALARESIGPYLEIVRILGKRIAEMHLALASNALDADFSPESFSPHYQRSLYQALRSQTRRTFELLRRRLPTLPEGVRGEAQRALESEEKILNRLRIIFERKITALRTRYHGDLHLSEVLFTGKDVVILDFEGEAHRPLSDRRLKRSPLRDVASMIRSFHYAASLHGMRAGALRSEDFPLLRPWSRFWHTWVSTVLLKAYLEAARQGSFLPRTAGELKVLLEFFLLERAVNELRHEMQHNAEWARIPLEAILALVETGL